MEKKDERNLDDINKDIGKLIDGLQGVFGDSQKLEDEAKKALDSAYDRLYQTMEEEYLDIFNGEFGQRGKGVYIGKLLPADAPEVTLLFMNMWTYVADQRLAKVEPYSDLYCTYMGVRAINYAEFETLFVPIDEEDYLKHIAYEFFMLSTQEEKDFLLRDITNDYDGYLKILEKGANRIHSFFLRPNWG